MAVILTASDTPGYRASVGSLGTTPGAPEGTSNYGGGVG